MTKKGMTKKGMTKKGMTKKDLAKKALMEQVRTGTGMKKHTMKNVTTTNYRCLIKLDMTWMDMTEAGTMTKDMTWRDMIKKDMT